MTEVFCSCGQRFLVRPEIVGRIARCTSCNQQFVLAPHVSQEELIEVTENRSTRDSRRNDSRFLSLFTCLWLIMDLELVAVVVAVYLSRPEPSIPATLTPMEAKHEIRQARGPFSIMPATAFRPHPAHEFQLYSSDELAKHDREARIAIAIQNWKDATSDRLKAGERLVRGLEAEWMKLRADGREIESEQLEAASDNEDNRLRDAWLAAGKARKKGRHAYLCEHLAEVLFVDQSSYVDLAISGAPKPVAGSQSYVALEGYMNRMSLHYDDRFSVLIRLLAPDWFGE